MLVGYARTSTIDQIAGFEGQQRDLLATGCTKLFIEQVSSVQVRAQLEAALEFVRENDVLVATRLDRLARSTRDLLRIIEALERKSVGLRILDFGGSLIDTTSPSGRLVVTVFGAMAEFERSIMLVRMREGIAKAKAEGKYKGREPTARRKAPDVLRLSAEGVGASQISERVGISRASVYRILDKHDRSGKPSTLAGKSGDRAYNGFTKSEREAASRTIERAIARGEVKEPSCCEICGVGAEHARLFKHLEDYREPLTFHGVCGKCHHSLHARFWEPERWLALIEGKQQDWFHALSLDESSRTRPFNETYPSGIVCYGPKVASVPLCRIPSTEWALRGIEVGENGDEPRNGVPQGTRT